MSGWIIAAVIVLNAVNVAALVLIVRAHKRLSKLHPVRQPSMRKIRADAIKRGEIRDGYMVGVWASDSASLSEGESTR